MSEEYVLEHIADNNFARFLREIENWEVYYKDHCTKKDDRWSTAVLLTTGVRIDKVKFFYYDVILCSKTCVTCCLLYTADRFQGMSNRFRSLLYRCYSRFLATPTGTSSGTCQSSSLPSETLQVVQSVHYQCTDCTTYFEFSLKF